LPIVIVILACVTLDDLKCDPGEREALTQGDPSTFFLTPHYEGSGLVLIRLASADPQEVAELFEDAVRARRKP
jgi:hypothetical protein